jgi:hypothetical protein
MRGCDEGFEGGRGWMGQLRCQIRVYTPIELEAWGESMGFVGVQVRR